MTDSKKRDEWEFSEPWLSPTNVWEVSFYRPDHGEVVNVYLSGRADPDGSLCLQRAREMAAAREMGNLLLESLNYIARPDETPFTAYREFGLKARKCLRRVGLLDGSEG